jgi:hypothetical protein
MQNVFPRYSVLELAQLLPHIENANVWGVSKYHGFFFFGERTIKVAYCKNKIK